MRKKEQEKKLKEKSKKTTVRKERKAKEVKVQKEEKKVSSSSRGRKFDKKAMIWGAIVGVALLVVVALILILNREAPIPDDYFKTDDTKIVITMDDEMTAFEDSEYEPEITHFVYYHNGDKIDNVKVFYEYGDEAEASAAYDHISMTLFTGKKLNGKYIVLQARGDEYEGLTVEHMLEQVKKLRAAGALVE